MPTVYKTASDRTKKSARWMVAWTDELGHRRTRRGYTDKALSERLARQLEDAARARREGTIDAAAERMADHSRRPLADHVADYRVYLAAKGSTEEHVDLTEARIAILRSGPAGRGPRTAGGGHARHSRRSRRDHDPPS